MLASWLVLPRLSSRFAKALVAERDTNADVYLAGADLSVQPDDDTH